MDHVLDRLVTICQGGHDGRVLAARLGEQVQGGVLGEHLQGGGGPAGEDDRVDLLVGRQIRTNLSARAGHQLQGFSRYTALPETLA